MTNTGQARVIRNERSEINAPGRAGGVAPRELTKDVGAHLVAFAADGGAEVEAELPGGESTLRQSFDATLDDASSRTAPARVQQPDGSGRVGNEDRDAVGNGDGERKPAFGSDMTVGAVDAEPSVPTIAMNHDARTVDLIPGRESSSIRRELLSELPPALHNESCWLIRGETKGPACARRREGANAER